MEFFSRLGLADPLAAALGSFGFASPTPVQADAIPIILSRRDAIIESETGTGKTFAYLAPAFQLVSVLERKGLGEPGVIVAAPTQELAVQIGRESERLAKAAGLGLKTVVLLGGTPLEKQAAKLKSKPEIIVGTLGRLADLVALGKLRTAALKLLVLDEADRLFANETEELARALLKSAPASCTRVLVSATIPERVRREARPLLRDAVEICPVGETVLSGSIEHWCFYCDGRKRLDFTRRFEAAVRPERCLVFLTMATRVEKAALALAALGLPVGAIHSGIDKETRRVALERFARGELRYLLTSDLGARGLDIPGITHVLSLDLPEEATVYTHRAGRTGRAGATGVSVVLADGVELARASKVATKGGFVFRCKVLEEGKILEPTSEEFFARAGAAEEQRMAAKASHILDDERRGPVRKRYDTQSPPTGYQRRDTKSAPQESRRYTKSSPSGYQRRDTQSAPQESRRYTKSSPSGYQRRDTQSAPQGSPGRHTKSSPSGPQRRDTKSAPQDSKRYTKSSPSGPQRRDTKSAPQEPRRYTKVPEGEAPRTARKPRSTPWHASPGKPSPGPHPAPRQRSDHPHKDRPLGSPAKTRRPPRP
jgi:superfamily II DNA/RNA helicase